ncbi:hypothetical protein [Fibrobacter sp.]|uniref:hypothetical protein n=1 Tax=Fibrobacter sp. TaxID=35828 RepID=UPI003866C9EF
MTLADFLNRCSFARLSSELLQSCNPFKCGNEDLDEFFREDFRLYGEKLLGKTYVFRLRERPESIVAAFTISNDSIRIKQLAPEDKANIEFAKQGFGSAVMDFIKAWFRSDENKTGCRFIIVDAINKPEVIHYYQKNNFKFLYSSEINEARALGINVKMLGEKPLHTRLMYFDLIDIK